MDFMQVKSGDKTLKIKLNESTISVLGRSFNLRPETIYLIGDETVIMPDASRVWFEDVMSFTVYEVHGDPPVQAPQDSPQDTSAPLLGNRFSYQSQQSSSRRSITPPPGVSGRKPYFPSRPTFTTTKTSGGEPTWRKNVIFSEVVDGKLSAIYQIYLTLTAETATVTKIAEMVSEEVGVRVMLLDSKGLRIMPSEATKALN
ncbi:hypothetical protein AC249_AIPGENE13492 [Exaiptasia diaphana]|nr:hypothetical protein AC249_AIPGENE13492 [Exaiptasia diaphana]